MRRRLGTFIAVTFLLIGGMAAGFNRPVAAQDPAGVSAQITAPTDGARLFGLVTITGSAAHPTAFSAYTLEYKDLREPAAPWFLVQERVTQQVQDGVLGAWNTIMVPDGFYELRLRVFLDDDQGAEFIVGKLQVANSQPTPVPTVASDLLGAGASTPTPGPSPTSPIEQPPSNNPAGAEISGLDALPAAEGELVSVDTAPSSGSTTRINLDRVRSAFCSGVYVAFVAFGAMVIYIIVRRHTSAYTRRYLWQTHDEYNDEQYQ